MLFGQIARPMPIGHAKTLRTHIKKHETKKKRTLDLQAFSQIGKAMKNLGCVGKRTYNILIMSKLIYLGQSIQEWTK